MEPSTVGTHLSFASHAFPVMALRQEVDASHYREAQHRSMNLQLGTQLPICVKCCQKKKSYERTLVIIDEPSTWDPPSFLC